MAMGLFRIVGTNLYAHLSLSHSLFDWQVHVELGCGDGRVNFHAVGAPFYVKKSVGVDVDEMIIASAIDRLDKHHPKPDLEFRMEDLMDPDAKVWEDIAEADIITMYFVEEALQKIRPRLEEALKNSKCRVVACGYEIPQWEADWTEIILDLPLFVYEFGGVKTQVTNAMHLHGVQLQDALRERQESIDSLKAEEKDGFQSPMERLLKDVEVIDAEELSSKMLEDEWNELNGITQQHTFDHGDEDEVEKEEKGEEPPIWKKPE